ncbi:cytochrome-c oxidase, cbb3-type subunit III [Thiohalobacter sp. IOR34]|uniref:cytochrome-c oxidase, cbb3-type subunit III n=1 Tax=Thiohalobacter sp. IOR34 TaxID=3057176 RepID=UPI0025B2375F|nr:cytochrome-c oxidase, cbb3-type subunit III [Thiohalobacter sp. IOR34]WJW75637.1 cytochrome-c oxidase, cbb3-type subunit III [Thiohalobacter sp. IOR34]
MNDFTFSSEFWNWWVILLTVGNILACWWLIVWTSKKRAGEAAAGEVTGHTWDETLQEFNNPLPRWWLWLFYGTLIFSAAYLVLYPGLGSFQGVLGWTEENQYDAEMQAAAAKYDPIFARYAQQDIASLAKDRQAVKIGQRLFLNYCSVCHGSDARGTRGFPNLTDNDWLYGGDPATIEKSILDGRQGAMPAWKDALGEQGVDEVAEYVLSLSGRKVDSAKAEAGKVRFETMCAACHGMDGKGNPALGAPNLTDNIWLYGGSPGTVRKTIAGGRNGRMPAHREFLGEDKVHLLAAYIYSLSAK